MPCILPFKLFPQPALSSHLHSRDFLSLFPPGNTMPPGRAQIPPPQWHLPKTILPHVMVWSKNHLVYDACGYICFPRRETEQILSFLIWIPQPLLLWAPTILAIYTNFWHSKMLILGTHPIQENHSTLTPPSGYCFSPTYNNTAPEEFSLKNVAQSILVMPWYRVQAGFFTLKVKISLLLKVNATRCKKESLFIMLARFSTTC